MIKRIAAALCCAVMTLSLASCGHVEVTDQFVGLENNSVKNESNMEYYNIVMYYDNSESGYYINWDEDNNSIVFDSIFASEERPINKFYAMDIVDRKYELYDLTDRGQTLNGDDGKKMLRDKSFYCIDETDGQAKRSPGIIQKAFFGKSPEIDPDAVTLVFTDLIELQNLIDDPSTPEDESRMPLGSALSEKYFSNPSCDVCLMRIGLPISTAGKPPIHRVDRNGTSQTIDSETQKDLDDQIKDYFLLIAGPGQLVDYYKATLESTLEAKKSSNDLKLEYDFTDYDVKNIGFTNKDFVDLNTDGSVEGDKFENSCVRISDETQVDKNDIWELKYDTSADKGVGSNKGYNSYFSRDFSVSGNLDISCKNYDISYFNIIQDEEDESDIEVVFTEGKEDEELEKLAKSLRKNELVYAMGNINCWYLDNGKPKKFTNERKKRFFKKLEVDGSRFNVISDNTDEAGINTVYISIPVYQILCHENRAPEWTERNSFVDGENYGGTDYKKSQMLHTFCAGICNYSRNNSSKHKDVDDQYSIKASLVGYVKFVVTDIA